MAEVRFATLNVYNLVRPGVRYYEQRPYSEREHDRKLDWIADTLRNARVDVVGFQEVFSEGSLKAAVARSGRFLDLDRVVAPGATPEENEEDGDGDDGPVALVPRVGLASRLPVEEVAAVVEFPEAARLAVPTELLGDDVADVPLERFQRPVLRAVVTVPDLGPTTVLVAHLKSKRPVFLDGEDEDDPAVRARASARASVVRVAEALALRALVLADAEGTDRTVVVLGDLNDGVDSITTRLVTGERPWRFARRRERERAYDVLLFSAAELQAQRDVRDVAFTHAHEGRHALLDHVLVSEQLNPANPGREGAVVAHRVVNDHLGSVLEGDAADRTTSDHGMPVVTVRTA